MTAAEDERTAAERPKRTRMKKIARAVSKLKSSVKNDARGAWSQGATIEVDYFALRDLIEFYDDSKVAAERVLIARDALENLYFGLDY